MVLEDIDVFPTSSPLAICRIVQYEIIRSEIRRYPIIVPNNAHVPNSSGDNLLVTIRTKTRPVKTLINPITKEINPE